MEIIQDNKEKGQLVEKIWKYVQADSVEEELSKSYGKILVYTHEVIGSRFFYNALISSFENSTNSIVYVGSGYYADLLFLVDLTIDSAEVLEDIMWATGQLDNGKSDVNVGLYTTTEKIFFLSRNENWIVVTDRYSDSMFIAFNPSAEPEILSFQEILKGSF
jgi:hypothetical protein